MEDPDLLLEEEEDLSYASMFAAALEQERASGAGGHASDDALGLSLGTLDSAPTAADSTTSNMAVAGSGSLFSDFDVGALSGGGGGDAGPTPLRPKLGSIALGGLLAGTPGSPFGSAPSSSSFGGFSSTPAQQQQQQQPSPLGGGAGYGQSPLGDSAVLHMGLPPVVASLPGGGVMSVRAQTHRVHRV